MQDHPAALFHRCLREADPRSMALAQGGGLVVRTLGAGLPLALIRASGVSPVALSPVEASAVTLPAVELGAGGRAQLASVFAAPRGQALLVATNAAAGARLFAILRELMRCGDLPPRPLHGIDLLRPHNEAIVRYNRARLADLAGWLVALGGSAVSPPSLAQTLSLEQRQGELLDQLDGWRSRPDARISGSDCVAARLAAGVLDPHEHVSVLTQCLGTLPDAPVLQGERVLVAGAPRQTNGVLQAIEALGWQVVADDGSVADDAIGCCAPGDEPWQAIACKPVQADAIDPTERARWTVARARQAGARQLLHFRCDGDEVQAWLRPFLAAECLSAGLAFCPIDVPASVSMHDAVRRSLAGSAAPPGPAGVEPAARTSAPRTASPAEPRSRKSLQAVADFSRYQREWFQSMRQRAQGGEPFAVVNADAPQELLRALDIPFVVNQWWASIVAAKQQSQRHLDLLRQHGYPTDAEPYSAQGLAAALDDQPDGAPWGGLPRPQWLMAFSGAPSTLGIHRAWAQRTGAELCIFDRTVDTRVDLPLEWWSRLPHEWDDLLERPRLDLVEGQFAGAIDRLERLSGRRFDQEKFVEVMNLVNEQEDWYRRTRDLIASCPHAPVGIVDTMPATMVPQWHRGTVWGRDAARALHDEVHARAVAGSVACPGERLRLMWVGRGLWSDMGFYQRWEASHGAVFVWSMYLALAADGYLRYWRSDQSPLRALAARFVTMGDELRMPTWAGAWHLREARTHRVDAVVAIDDADPLVLRTLENAGIPVLRLALDNFAGASAGRDDAAQRVTTFLDGVRGHPQG